MFPTKRAGMFFGLPRSEMVKIAAKTGIPMAATMIERLQSTAAYARGRDIQQTAATRHLPNSIVGFAIRYGEPLWNYTGNDDGIPVVFLPGCFDAAIDSEDILLVSSHDWTERGHILARTGNATLGVESRPDGVFFSTAPLEDTPYTRWAVSAMRGGPLKSCSIGWEFITSDIANFHGITARVVALSNLGHIALTGSPACKGAWIKLIES